MTSTTTTYAVWIHPEGRPGDLDSLGWNMTALLGEPEALAVFARSVTAGQPCILANPDDGTVIYRFDG